MSSINALHREFSITIIGAGVGGLTLAIGLLRHNIPVQIYEAAPTFQSAGFGISVGPAAHRALSLIDPSISQAYDSLVTTHADSPGYEDFRQTWFELVWATEAKCGQVMTNLKTDSLGQTSVHRRLFLQSLIDSLPAGVLHFGKNLVDLHEMEHGVSLRFEDGISTMADIVIGCDGLHSRVRKSTLPREQIQPQYSGVYAYRTVLDMKTMVDAVGDRRARVASIYMGEGAYVVTYPIMHATQVNVGLYKLNSNGNVESRSRLASRKEMMDDFAHLGDPVPSILQRIDHAAQWAIHDIPALSTYTRNHIVILGDAAHATTPHQAAGAGQAIEDAHVLTELLSDPRVLTREHVRSAFYAYDAIRRPRSQWVVKTSRDFGYLLSLSLDSVSGGKASSKQILGKRLALLWNRDIQDQAETARSVMVENLQWVL